MNTITAEPTSVGEMLREEFLKPLNITQEQLAKAMGLSRKVVNQIVNDQRRLNLDEAVLLAGLFETDPDFWINVQAAHDRWEAQAMVKNHPVKPLMSMAFS